MGSDSVVDGYTYIDHHSWDAYNECADFDTHISLYVERFGRRPFRFFADKIYMTRENRRKLKELGIQCMGERLGRPPKVKSREQVDNERIGNSLRNEVEAAFETSKRVYRADNIRAKLPGTAECWTGMCYLVKNLTKFLRGLCRVLTEMSPSMRILSSIRLAFGELAQGIMLPCYSEAKMLIA